MNDVYVVRQNGGLVDCLCVNHHPSYASVFDGYYYKW